MKVVKIELLGAPCYLSFTGEAMFQIREKFGGVKELLERVQPDTREGAAALCEAVAILAEQAELGRRHLGYTPCEVPNAETLAAAIMPLELIAMKAALPRAIELGYGREVREEDEIDLGLAELRQKKRFDARPLYTDGHGMRDICKRSSPHDAGRAFRRV